MSSDVGPGSFIDSVYARIQQIQERIRQIQKLADGPPGQQATTSAQPASKASSGSKLDSTDTSATVRSPEFQKLLEEAIALGQAGNSQSAGLGSGSAIDSLLGLGQTKASGLSDSTLLNATDNGGQLKAYQDALLQAIRDLRSNQGSSAAKPKQ